MLHHKVEALSGLMGAKSLRRRIAALRSSGRSFEESIDYLWQIVMGDRSWT